MMKAKAQPRQRDYRERIIRSAADIFLKRGFAQTSTEEIARRAKVSKRELYLAFPGKRALLSAAVTELQYEMQSRMDLRWSSQSELAEVLRQAATAIVDFILSDRFGKLLRIVAEESRHDRPMAQQFLQLGPVQGRKATARFFKRQMASGNLRKANPLIAADDFLDIVVSARLLTAVAVGCASPAYNIRAHVKHAVEVFLAIYGLTAPRQR
jgi:TetR/AcrR family transcriptional regulator, mexJK operon transcriptional repressor